MSCLAKILPLAVVLTTVLGCAKGAHGPSIETPVTAAPRPLDKLTVAERRAILERAQVWRPIDTANLNLLTGPAAADAIPFDANVTCDYKYPDKPVSGVTPKFDCELKPGDVVKVKYGENNGEVFAEVAASRLFWALGFNADRMYPVKVTCRNCPPDPFKESGAEWRLGKSAKVATRVYDPAAIERKFDGEAIEVPGYEGWGWAELETLRGDGVGATPAHVDALKLLAVFVQHVDSKPEQQALVCLEGGERKDRSGNAQCTTPVLMVKDLGSTFGAASRIRYDKMKLESWRSVEIWKDKKTCQGDLTKSLIGTLEHPMIGEAGRKFLADRLSLLSDKQLLDLFTAARVERRDDKIDGRQATAPDWVRVFKEKRDQVVKHRCPTT